MRNQLWQASEFYDKKIEEDPAFAESPEGKALKAMFMAENSRLDDLHQEQMAMEDSSK